MHPHGDPIISGVESVPDKPHQGERPTCGYTVREKVNGVETVKQCKSPEVTWNITGHGRYGAAKQTPVCDRHIEKAWKEWAVDSAVPINRS